MWAGRSRDVGAKGKAFGACFGCCGASRTRRGRDHVRGSLVCRAPRPARPHKPLRRLCAPIFEAGLSTRNVYSLVLASLVLSSLRVTTLARPHPVNAATLGRTMRIEELVLDGTFIRFCIHLFSSADKQARVQGSSRTRCGRRSRAGTRLSTRSRA
jgi:hypothetical protein